jgi:transposase
MALLRVRRWQPCWCCEKSSEKEPEGWSAADKFTVVLESAGLNATELSGYCRERGLFPEQVERWRQAAQDANAKPVLTMAEQKELEKLRAQDQREIKALKKELQRKEKAMAEMAALLVLRKKWEAFCSEDAEG